MTQHRTHSTEETYALAASFLKSLSANDTRATLLALEGNLGSGKTTFVQGLALALGITEPITSPTFVIQKSYPTANEHFKTLVHIDAYRLDGDKDMAPLHWEETLALPHTLVCIEWPDIVPTSIPIDAHRLSFSFIDDQTRDIVIPE